MTTTTSSADYVYVELLKYKYGYNQDATLINPARFPGLIYSLGVYHK